MKALKLLVLLLAMNTAQAGLKQDAITSTAFVQWVHMHCNGIISRSVYQTFKQEAINVSELKEHEFERRLTAELDSMQHYYLDMDNVCAFTRDKLLGVKYGGI